MFNITINNIDKLSVPFGIVIGPCTILSNIVKLIGDIAKIAFYGLKSINYTPSQAYTNFKKLDKIWEQKISSYYKPQFNKDGFVEVDVNWFADPEQSTTLNNVEYHFSSNYVLAYPQMSTADKTQVAFERAKEDSIRHLSFIGIGIIRSIPVVGGLARCVYN